MKYIALNDSLCRYILEHRSGADDPLLADLQAETASLGDIKRMQISPEQGSWMRLLTALLQARRALEVGTFTGYSSICIARGLAPGGRLICMDENREWTDIARRYWRRAGLEDRIELRLGPAIDSLNQLPADEWFDLVFIDAAKEEYSAYFEIALPHVRPNGLLLFDNMLWGGRLGQGPVSDPAGKAIDQLNWKLARDPRVETVLLSVSDGIQFCRKR